MVRAGRPTFAYLIRTRSRYELTVRTEMPRRCATNSFDSDWNHSMSTISSRAESWGRSLRAFVPSAPASAGGM